MKFYEKTWFLWLSLIFFAPVGIILMWRQQRFSKVPRIILAVFFSFVFLIEVAAATTETQQPAAPPVTQAEQQPEEPQPPANEPQEATQEENVQAPEETPVQEDEPASVAAVAPVAAPSNSPTPASTGTMKVHFIDVGQADSILIQSGETSVLVDAGNNADGDLVVNYLKSQGVSKLAAVIGTHPHEDHIGGMDTVIKSFDVERVYMPRATANTKTFEDVLLAIEAKGLKIKEAKAGVTLDVPGITGTFLAPVGSNYEDLNNYSAVLKIVHGSTAFLLTGDAEDVSENQMLASGHDLKATVLKVGHHGSDSSTTAEFLKAVNPKYAVISVGKDNSYGHPTEVVLNRLASAGVQIYRTDVSGNIIATSDGFTVTFNTSPTQVVAKPSNNNAGASNNSQPAAAPSTPAPTTAPEPTQTATQLYVLNTSTKKFHLPSCSRLPTKNRSDRETTRDELINSGYSPCSYCKP